MSTFTDIAAATLQTATVNPRAGVQSQVHDSNEALKTDYLTILSHWSRSAPAGRADNGNPPKPPNAYMVAAVLPEPGNVRCVTAGDTMPLRYASPTPYGIEFDYARIV